MLIYERAPEDTEPPAPPQVRRYARDPLFYGVFLLIIWIVVPRVPRDGTTLAAVHGLCQSGAGELAQALSAGVQAECSRVALAYAGLGWCFWTGLGLTAWGLAREAVRASQDGTRQ